MKEDKPKIAMIIGSLLRSGGTEKHFLQLLDGLNEDFNFVVFHLNPERGKAFELLSKRTEVFNLNFIGTFSGVINAIYSAFALLRKEKPSLIYSSTLIGLILILPFSIIYRVPIISARRSLYSKYSKSIFTWSILMQKIIFWINNISSKKIIGNSEAVGSLTLNDAFSKNKYITINNGLDSGSFSKIDKKRVDIFRKEFNLKSEDFIIGSVGNYRKVKNYKQIIQAADYILKKDQRIKFIILGEGIERDDLERMIKSNGLENNVILTGYRPDLAEALSIIDIFLMTSISEGSPNALIEACSMKKVVIGTDVPSINEIINHGKNGFLVKLHDSEALANMILKIYDDFENMDKIKEEAFKTVLEDFDLEKNLAMFRKIFSEAINKH